MLGPGRDHDNRSGRKLSPGIAEAFQLAANVAFDKIGMPDAFEGDFDRWEHDIALSLAARRRGWFPCGIFAAGRGIAYWYLLWNIPAAPSLNMSLRGDFADSRRPVRLKWGETLPI